MRKLLQDHNIGKNIQDLRLSKGMTQADLVVALENCGREMSINTLSQIENGKRNIFVSDLVRLKLIFNVPFDAFFNNIHLDK